MVSCSGFGDPGSLCSFPFNFWQSLELFSHNLWVFFCTNIIGGLCGLQREWYPYGVAQERPEEERTNLQRRLAGFQGSRNTETAKAKRLRPLKRPCNSPTSPCRNHGAGHGGLQSRPRGCSQHLGGRPTKVAPFCNGPPIVGFYRVEK